jgi:DNA-binding NarL/FixJ family response regulator
VHYEASQAAMITVVLASESRLLRQLLGDALSGRGNLSVVATAPDHRRALALTEDLRADVAVVSMAMPEADLLVRALVAKSARVVSLGPCDQEAVAVVDDGVLPDVVAAIHGVMHGAVTAAPLPSQLDYLTPAERRVLQLVNEGRADKEVAVELGVAVATVKHHVHAILGKLGVSSRGRAAAIYRTNTSVRTPARSAPGWPLRPGRLRPT